MNKYLLMLCCLFLLSCQTLKNLWGKKEEVVPQVAAAPKDLGSRYSDTQQMPTATDRQYKRMTKTRMEEESELQSSAGSLWVMDGQQSYLFAQNKTRREGDIVNIKLDGTALKQVETKVSVIKKLLKQLEEEEQKAVIQQQSLAAKASAGTDRAPAAATNLPTPAKIEAPAKEEKQDLSEVQTIQTKITERMADGNYRVKGAQPFMIGQKEYKVIVMGIIRPEDYNDEGILSGKLLDPQFDVMSVRRKAKDDKTALF